MFKIEKEISPPPVKKNSKTKQSKLESFKKPLTQQLNPENNAKVIHKNTPDPAQTPDILPLQKSTDISSELQTQPQSHIPSPEDVKS